MNPLNVTRVSRNKLASFFCTSRILVVHRHYPDKFIPQPVPHSRDRECLFCFFYWPNLLKCRKIKIDRGTVRSGMSYVTLVGDWNSRIPWWKCFAVRFLMSSTSSSAWAHSSTNLRPYKWVLWHSAVNARWNWRAVQVIIYFENIYGNFSAATGTANRINSISDAYLSVAFRVIFDEGKSSVLLNPDQFLWQSHGLQLTERSEIKRSW